MSKVLEKIAAHKFEDKNLLKHRTESDVNYPHKQHHNISHNEICDSMHNNQNIESLCQCRLHNPLQQRNHGTDDREFGLSKFLKIYHQAKEFILVFLRGLH